LPSFNKRFRNTSFAKKPDLIARQKSSTNFFAKQPITKASLSLLIAAIPKVNL